MLPDAERNEPNVLLATHAALGEEGDYANLSADSLYLDEYLMELTAIEGFVSVLSQFEDLVPENPIYDHDEVVARAVQEAARNSVSQLVDFALAFSPFDYSGFAKGQEHKPAVLGDVLAGEMDGIMRAFYDNHVLDLTIITEDLANRPARDYLGFDLETDFPDVYSDLDLIYQGEAQHLFSATIAFYAVNIDSSLALPFDPYERYATLDGYVGLLRNEAALLYHSLVYESLTPPPQYHYFDFTDANLNVDEGLAIGKTVPFSFERVAELSKAGLI